MSHDPQPGPGGPPPNGPHQAGPHGTGPHHGAPGPQPPLTQGDERLWATIAHVSIPFVGFLGPLIVWLVFKDRSSWLRVTVAEALNFSILYTIAQCVAVVLLVVIIGMILMPLIAIAGLILCILAAMAANRGDSYHYPVNLRLVK
jgi:uncharacterized Tic20 family protein